MVVMHGTRPEPALPVTTANKKYSSGRSMALVVDFFERGKMEKRNILLVEDDASIRDIIKSAFEQKYNILEASRCSEAAELLHDPMSLALIDYMLPDRDGFYVVKMVREKNPALPIIFMTAYSSEDLAIKAVRAGVTDYIKKPLVLTHLLKKVSAILTGETEVGLTDCVGNKEEFLVEGIVAFMESNYFKDITRDWLARKLNMNKHDFSKLFNKRFGQGMKSYLNNIRLRKAAELLMNHDLTIGGIAFSVGFKSVEHFVRVFKSRYGMPPTEYRIQSDKLYQPKKYLWETDN